MDKQRYYDLELATTTNITTTYVGEDSDAYLSAAVLSADSLVNGSITVMPNIKFKQVLPRTDFSSIIKNRSCDFEDTGTVTYTEVVITPELFSINLQLCKNDWRSTWMAEQMGFSANDNLAPSFASHLVALAAENVAAGIENSIWQGVNATVGEFDGFEVLFLSQAAQPAAMEIAGTALSASNIVAQIALMTAQVPSTMFKKQELNILLGTEAIQFYINAQAALGYQDNFNVGETPLNFQGYEIKHCPGMSDDTGFLVNPDNFIFGSGVLADQEDILVLDMKDRDGSDNVRIVANYSAAVQVAIPEEVITYGITNSGN